MFTVFYYGDGKVAVYQDDTLIFDGNVNKTVLLIKAISGNITEYNLEGLVPTWTLNPPSTSLIYFKEYLRKILIDQVTANLYCLKLLANCELISDLVNPKLKEFIDAQVL